MLNGSLTTKNHRNIFGDLCFLIIRLNMNILKGDANMPTKTNIIVTNVFINEDKEKIRIEINKKIENLLKKTWK